MYEGTICLMKRIISMEVLCVSFVVPFVRRRMFIPLHTFVRNLAMQRVKKGAMRSAPIGLRGRLRLSVCLSVPRRLPVYR